VNVSHVSAAAGTDDRSTVAGGAKPARAVD